MKSFRILALVLALCGCVNAPDEAKFSSRRHLQMFYDAMDQLRGGGKFRTDIFAECAGHVTIYDISQKYPVKLVHGGSALYSLNDDEDVNILYDTKTGFVSLIYLSGRVRNSGGDFRPPE